MERVATMARRKRELKEWEAALPGTIADPELFVSEILPGLQRVPLNELARATGLTRGCLSQIRGDEKMPHPRHWPASGGGWRERLIGVRVSWLNDTAASRCR
jgi:hypothetical protein